MFLIIASKPIALANCLLFKLWRNDEMPVNGRLSGKLTKQNLKKKKKFISSAPCSPLPTESRPSSIIIIPAQDIHPRQFLSANPPSIVAASNLASHFIVVTSCSTYLLLLFSLVNSWKRLWKLFDGNYNFIRTEHLLKPWAYLSNWFSKENNRNIICSEKNCWTSKTLIFHRNSVRSVLDFGYAIMHLFRNQK